MRSIGVAPRGGAPTSSTIATPCRCAIPSSHSRATSHERRKAPADSPVWTRTRKTVRVSGTVLFQPTRSPIIRARFAWNPPVPRGPRDYRHENRTEISRADSHASIFNGAATLSSRKCGARITLHEQDESFNGAATLSSRKFPRTGTKVAKGTVLQWGRDVIVAEIGGVHPGAPVLPKLQWGRDVIVAEIRQLSAPLRALSRFNGAATLSSRKSADTISHRQKRGASMGPRRYRRGNTDSRSRPHVQLALQWGRDVIVAEIRC
uniref:Uncharacterized protein n=1 Tax=mine drainage metagenome TaxID=410659 RepID=E6Q6S1_9ZZZZ